MIKIYLKEKIGKPELFTGQAVLGTNYLVLFKR